LEAVGEMTYRCGIAVLICLAAIGCRRGPYMDAYFDMLNAEKRALEDRLYELEYNYEEALKELEACRAKTGAKGQRRRGDDGDLTEEPDALPEIELPPGFDLETDDAADDSVLRPPSSGAERLASREVEPETGDFANGSAKRAVADRRVEYIFINPRLTKCEDFDLQRGDDGLTVMIEPRNKDGQFVPKPASVSIVLLDPSKRDQAARYARWDFEEDVARKVLRVGALDRGLLFRVPWPETPPDSDRLHLFVRYSTEDGRMLEADREITVRPPEHAASNWSQRPDSARERIATRPADAAQVEQGDRPDPTTVRAVHGREIANPAASSSAE